MALRHAKQPDVLATVFAGARHRSDRPRAQLLHRLTRPRRRRSAFFKDGKLVYMLERQDIEIRSAEMIAAELTSAFDRVCG